MQSGKSDAAEKAGGQYLAEIEDVMRTTGRGFLMEMSKIFTEMEDGCEVNECYERASRGRRPSEIWDLSYMAEKNLNQVISRSCSQTGRRDGY